MNAETLADLIRRGAKVRWSCDVGNPLGYVPNHGGDVDLEAVAAARGQDFTLANRRPACPAANCPGRISFSDRTSIFARSLDTISAADPAWFAHHELRRQELTELGWTMERGYWKPPTDWPAIAGWRGARRKA